MLMCFREYLANVARLSPPTAAMHAKVCAAEQEALQSFMVAVFDIFGHLVWKTSTIDDEPHLCFEDEPNVALDELLQQPLRGQSLEALLGMRSEISQRERLRLWEYASAEASSSEAEPRSNTRICARKIGLTCRKLSF